MATSYAVNLSQKFAVFDIEEDTADPNDIISIYKKTSKVEKVKIEKEVNSTKKEQSQVESTKPQGQAKNGKKKQNQAISSSTNVGKVEKNNVPTKTNLPANKTVTNQKKVDVPVRNKSDAPRAPRRNDRKHQDFGNRGGNHHQFDRHSGSNKTGVKAVEKKLGGGSYNWGNDDAIFDDAVKEVHSTSKVLIEDNNEDKKEADSENRAEEPEVQYMTLTEYFKTNEKESERFLHGLKLDGTGGRKNNLGEDSEKKKNTINVDIRYVSKFQRGGRRPRGGGRGQSFDVRERNYEQNAQASKDANLFANKDEDFPALGQ